MEDLVTLDAPVNSQLVVLTILLLAFFCGFGTLTLYTEYRRNRLRFSLRTLLIATTLVALLLGAIVWAVK